MIVDFKCNDTQTLFATGKIKRWSAIKNGAERKLLLLDNASPFGICFRPMDITSKD